MRETSRESAWNWDHRYAALPERCHCPVPPTPVREPRVFAFNEPLAKELGLESLLSLPPNELAETFSGNRLPPGAHPLAMAYAGHQYGHFVVLGDGRAILLGEHIDPTGRRHDIQLKGAGRTPFSRGGDGRCALGPALREFLISEAMAALGIPSTRSLAVVETGERVLRAEDHPGAVLTRTAASHVRVGTFALFAARQDKEALEALLAHTIARHYPDLANTPDPALALLRAVLKRQAALVAQWMSVGFVHGVLNTDNVALSGETIDFGPCAFIDRYHRDAVYSSIDRHGRYAYGNQPAVTAWNLARFAEALLPLIGTDTATSIARANEVLAEFGEVFNAEWLRHMACKIGIENPLPVDKTLVEDWLALLEKHRIDFTNAHRALAGDPLPERGHLTHPDFAAWHKHLEARLHAAGIAPEAAQQLRARTNPRHIPRNHAVQKALDAAEAGDPAPFFQALAILRRPFDEADNTVFSTTPSGNDQVHTTFCGT